MAAARRAANSATYARCAPLRPAAARARPLRSLSYIRPGNEKTSRLRNVIPKERESQPFLEEASTAARPSVRTCEPNNSGAASFLFFKKQKCLLAVFSTRSSFSSKNLYLYIYSPNYIRTRRPRSRPDVYQLSCEPLSSISHHAPLPSRRQHCRQQAPSAHPLLFISTRTTNT
jgi:hypothetical protein